MTPSTRTLDYRDGETSLAGVLATPEPGPGRQTGILLVHGGAGLDEHAREQVVRYAALGYPVFACDMFGAGVAGDRERVMATLLQLRSDRAQLERRVAAGCGVLRDQGVTGRLAVVGFCFGGLVALEAARAGLDFAAVVSVHGSLATSNPAGPGSIAGRVLACHGGSDPHVPMSDVTAFCAEMTAAQADWQLNVYGGAQHGFTHRSAITPANGVAYDRATDERSFDDIAAVLRSALA